MKRLKQAFVAIVAVALAASSVLAQPPGGQRPGGPPPGGPEHDPGRAVLEALVEDEVRQLTEVLKDATAPPIVALLQYGSSHLGNDGGVLTGLTSREEKLDYLSALDEALAAILHDALATRLTGYVKLDTNPEHVAELFLTINSHINRREILGLWSRNESAGFAATALSALAPLLQTPSDLEPIISGLQDEAQGS